MNYDFKSFHAVCGDRSVVSGPDGLYVVCNKCGVAANLEGIAGKVDSADACKIGDVERKITGDQSFSVNKGGYVQK